MALANLKVVEDEEPTQERRLATEPYRARFNDPITPEPIPIRKGRHLDVDKVLERSLPRVAEK